MRILIILAIVVGIVVIVGFRLLSNAPARRNRSEDQEVAAVPGEEPRPPTPAEDPGPATEAGEPAPGSRRHRAEHGKP